MNGEQPGQAQSDKAGLDQPAPGQIDGDGHGQEILQDARQKILQTHSQQDAPKNAGQTQAKGLTEVNGQGLLRPGSQTAQQGGRGRLSLDVDVDRTGQTHPPKKQSNESDQIQKISRIFQRSSQAGLAVRHRFGPQVIL